MLSSFFPLDLNRPELILKLDSNDIIWYQVFRSEFRFFISLKDWNVAERDINSVELNMNCVGQGKLHVYL